MSKSYNLLFAKISLWKQASVKNEIVVDGEMGVNLFRMTPYYFKTELGAEEKIRKNDGYKTEIHFDFLIYRKK